MSEEELNQTILEHSHEVIILHKVIMVSFFVIGILVFLFWVLLRVFPPLCRDASVTKFPDRRLKTGEIHSEIIVIKQRMKSNEVFLRAFE